MISQAIARIYWSVLTVGIAILPSCSKPSIPAKGTDASKAGNAANGPVIVNVTQINGGPVTSEPMPMPASPEPIQSPEIPPPPAFAKPEELINAFCERWIKQDMAGMYSLLDEKTRADLDWPTFHRRLTVDAEFNGGLKSGTILGQLENLGGQATFRVQLEFQSVRSPNRIVIAKVKNSSSGWLLMESGLIPPDLSQQ